MLTQEEQDALRILTNDVESAIARRRAWLDRKMDETSDLHIGDEIYDVRTGTMLGVVRKLYRFWRDRNEGVLDDSVSCEYEYEFEPGCLMNTSSQPEIFFGTKEDARRHHKHQYDMLGG